MWQFVSLIVADLQVEWRYDTSAGTKNSMSHGVGTNDGCRFAKSIALEHWHTHSAEIALQLNVQQCTTAHEEAHSAAKAFAYGLEYDLVKELYEWPAPCLPTATIPVLFVVFDGIVEGKLIESLYGFAFGFNACLNVLAEVTRQRRHREHQHGAYLFDSNRDILERSDSGPADRHSRNATAVVHHCIETCYMGEAVVEW